MNDQSGPPVLIRVQRISGEGYHHIMVPEQGHVMCSCNGESWCSHIDATLVAGERHMVHPRDRRSADVAQIRARGRIGATANWKAHWRTNRKWRGLPTRETTAQKLIRAGEPVLSVDAKGTTAENIRRIAKEHGWKISPRPTKGVLIHVHGDEPGKRTEYASFIGIMVISAEQWEAIAPIGDTLRDRIVTLIADECPS